MVEEFCPDDVERNERNEERINKEGEKTKKRRSRVSAELS
jgi:hypothetical protein